MPAESGQTLSHYRLTEKIGAGGMGVVWKARDTVLDRDVAIKILPAEVSRDEQRRRMFLEEAKLASSISDAHIVEVHDFAREGDLDFIVMEYVVGRPLGEVIGGRPMPPERVADLGAQMAGALARAHRKRLLHRDLKPANVLVTPDGDVKIVDFGLAVLFEREDSVLGTETVTRSALHGDDERGSGRQIAGTVPYMSPEQVRGEKLDARSDIFSLGSILYEMTTGKRPFAGGTTAELVEQIEGARPVAPHDVAPTLPMELDRIIRKALSARASDRYQAADDLAVDLNRLGREIETGSSLSYADALGTRTTHRKPVLAASLIAIVVVLAATTAWWFGSRDRPESAAGPGTITSLAVLPFDNLMGDEEQDYFVEGMHEALITDLAKIGSLRVISRTSAMRYKGSDKPIPQIATELGVDALIEGSVLRADGKVRITAQLIDGRTDEHLWAENYDRDTENTLQLLSQVARAIATEIQVSVTPREERLLESANPVNPDAHDAVLRGVYHFNRGDLEGIRTARGHFERAIEIEPSFAPAWSYLAGCYLLLGFFGMEPASEVIPEARKTANRALAEDDQQELGRMVLGYVALFFDWDFETAKRELERSVELNPTNVFARHGLADYLGITGDLEGSLDQVRLGRSHDPMGFWANQVLVGHLFMARHYEEAVDEGARMLELFPNSRGIRSYVADSLWALGRYDEAMEHFREGWGAESDLVRALERGYTEGGPRAAKRARAEQLAALSETEPVDPLLIARYYASVGEIDSAFVWLERAFEKRVPQILHVPLDPRFDSLRADSRYEELLDRIGIPTGRS
jgi:serine/threonine protein kinase/tetratricopeptide (TPR) repeat protein